MRYIEENLMKLFEAIELKFGLALDPKFEDDGFCVSATFPDKAILHRTALEYIADKVKNHDNPNYAIGYAIRVEDGKMVMMFY